jgi:hypothetical protein
MNVFEDLIVELQEENLLEQTVIAEKKPPPAPAEAMPSDAPEPAFLSDGLTAAEPLSNGFGPYANGAVDDQPANGFDDIDDALNAFVEQAGNELTEIDPPATVDESIHITAESEPSAEFVSDTDADTVFSEPGPPVGQAVEAAASEVSQPEPAPVVETKKVKQPREKDAEFFKKRAVAEVAGLQMVDHVLTGVEREYMKVIPATFDDFNAKKALNAFLQASPEGQAEAEFALMQETEVWCTALAARDARVPVSSLRLYCENTKPVLSSQALLAIARFYRNLPYSESVRAKFDFVMTRLFSRPAADDKRVCLFDRVESLDHINTLYGEWSSVPLYTAEDDESKVLLTALSFEDLAVEAENAGSFDQLITSDFFGRLRLFKESIAELFFAPSVTSAAIEANVRIGNAYVVLIAREREKLDADTVQSKYFGFDDQSVSDAAGQSLGLVDILTRKTEPEQGPEPSETEVPVNADPQKVKRAAAQPEVIKKAVDKKPSTTEKVGIVERLKENALNVNRWFLLAAGVLVVASFGIYLWSNYLSGERVPTSGVATVSVQVPGFAEHVKAAKISNGTLYVHLLDTWDALPQKKRLDLLHNAYQAGASEGWERVQLIAFDGKQAGFASASREEVPEP